MAERTEAKRRNTPVSFAAVTPRGFMNKVVGRSLIGFGVFGMLIEIGKHYGLLPMLTESGHLFPSICYAIAIFVGWYMESAAQAKDVTGVIANVGVSFIVAMRQGRRSTDPIIAVPVSTAGAGMGAGTPEVEMPPPEKTRLDYGTARKRRTGEGE